MSRFGADEEHPITYRKMSLLDIGGVHAIESESFPTPWRRRTFVTRLILSDHYGYVAEAERRVVGYVVFGIRVEGVHLQKIAVTKPYRRRGIATRLMEIVLEQGRAHGAETIFLEVRAGNQAAQKFYEAFDFALDHVQESYYRDTGEAAQVLVRRIETAG